MKLIQLHIYGYGRFQQKSIKLAGASLHVIYGKNEAGKSTIRSFIHSILFGFPQKQQPESKYEPLSGAPFGGAIDAVSDTYGPVRIERLPGKGGGEASVYYGKGEKAGQEMLDELTGGMDKNFYNAVFSFDIHGLQQVHQLGEDEIGKYLYLTSMVGTDAVYRLEDQLAKEREKIYKPSGRKPLLNEMLAKAKKTSEELKHAKQNNLQYEELQARKLAARQTLEALDSKKAGLKARLRKEEKLKSLLPLLKEKEHAEKELKKLPDTAGYPADGLQRLEQLQASLRPEKGRLQALLAQQKRLMEQAKGLQPDLMVLSKKEAAEELKHSLQAFEDHLQRIEAIEKELQQLQAGIKDKKRELFSDSLMDEEVLALPAGIGLNSRIRELEEKRRLLSERKRLLDEQFERVKEALEESEAQVSRLKEGLLKPEERNVLLTKASELTAKIAAGSRKSERAELKETSEQLKLHEQAKKAARSRLLAFLSIAFLALLAGAVYSFSAGQTFAGFLLVFLLLLLAVFFFMQKGKDPVYEHLAKKKQQLEEELLRSGEAGSQETAAELEETNGKLQRDAQLRQMQEAEAIQLSEKERAYDRIVGQFESWEKEWFFYQEECSDITGDLMLKEQLQGDLSAGNELLAELREAISKKQKLLQEKSFYQDKIDRFMNLFRELGSIHADQELSIKERIFEANAYVKKELEKEQQHEQLSARIAEINEELAISSEKADYEEALIINLLNKASVQDEEAFRLLAAAAEKRGALEEKLGWIKVQLEEQGEEDLSAGLLDALEQELLLEELKQKLSQAEEKEKAAQQELSQTDYRIQELEKNGTYSDLLHEYELQKSEIRKLSKEWITAELALDFLKKTNDYHRSVRLPKLLKKAEELFIFLTGGAYTAIYLPGGEETFIAERKDGTRFQAKLLSQATAEQLYISLRLALVSVLNEKHRLPIIIDDGFVHFDEERTARMLELLHKMAEEQQILFFTCHSHLLSSFEEGSVTKLTGKSSPRPSEEAFPKQA